MSLVRFRLPIAAPLAGLFLVGGLSAIWLQQPRSVGLDLPLTKMRVEGGVCIDRKIVVQLKKDGSTWINESPLSLKELRPKLTQIYENRAEKVVLFIPDRDVSFEQFAQVYSTVVSSTSKLHVELISSGFHDELLWCPEGTSCGIDWPDGYHASCAWTNQPMLRKPTADPSTTPGAKNAPDSAQDDRTKK